MFSSYFCWRTLKLSIEKMHLIMLLSLGTSLCVLSCYRTTPLKFFCYESCWTIFIMPKKMRSLLKNWPHHQNQKKNRAIWKKETPNWYKFITRVITIWIHFLYYHFDHFFFNLKEKLTLIRFFLIMFIF